MIAIAKAAAAGGQRQALHVMVIAVSEPGESSFKLPTAITEDDAPLIHSGTKYPSGA